MYRFNVAQPDQINIAVLFWTFYVLQGTITSARPCMIGHPVHLDYGPSMTLAKYIREVAGLTGTKVLFKGGT